MRRGEEKEGREERRGEDGGEETEKDKREEDCRGGEKRGLHTWTQLVSSRDLTPALSTSVG